MTADDWERVIDDAHALSVDTVQFIGGEPTFHLSCAGSSTTRSVRDSRSTCTPTSYTSRWSCGSCSPCQVCRWAPRGTQPTLTGTQTSPEARAAMPARGVGRAARGIPDISELCGQCGRGRAAITLHGDLSPCVIGRFLVAGNVKDERLSDILGGARGGSDRRLDPGSGLGVTGCLHTVRQQRL